MHAAIESAKKKTQIFFQASGTLSFLYQGARMDPYTFVPIRYTDVLDYKDMKTHQLKPQQKSNSGQKVSWIKMRQMRFTKENKKPMYFKYDIRDELQSVEIVKCERLDEKFPEITNKIFPFQQRRKKMMY